MLEFAATAWAYALVVTTVLFLTVLLAQAVVRHARAAARTTGRIVEAPTPSSRVLTSVGSRAA